MLLAVCLLYAAAASIASARTSIEEQPYVASVEYKGRYISGATIVSRRLVISHALMIASVTAGDDVAAGSLLVRAGSELAGAGGSAHVVCDWVNGEEVSLLGLAVPIVFDGLRRPIRLLERGDGLVAGARVRLSAWLGGRLRSYVATVGDDSCQEGLGSDGFCVDRQAGFVGYAGVGNPVVLDGRLAGVVEGSAANYTYVVPVYRIYSSISSMMKEMDEDTECRGHFHLRAL